MGLEKNINIGKTIFTGELEKEQQFFQEFFKEIFFKEQFILCESLIMYFPSIFEIEYSLQDRFKRLFNFKTELKNIGTSNFVVFEPSDVKILEKNSQPVSRKELIEEQINKLK